MAVRNFETIDAIRIAIERSAVPIPLAAGANNFDKGVGRFGRRIATLVGVVSEIAAEIAGQDREAVVDQVN